MTDEHGHEDIKRLLAENHTLLEENQKLLKQINSFLWWGFGIKMLWYAVLIGAPFLLYYYVIEPYMTLFGGDLDAFKAWIP